MLAEFVLTASQAPSNFIDTWQHQKGFDLNEYVQNQADF